MVILHSRPPTLLELVQFGNVWRSNIGTASVLMERLTMRTHITFIRIPVNAYNTREDDDVMIMLLLATVLSIPCRTLSDSHMRMLWHWVELLPAT